MNIQHAFPAGTDDVDGMTLLDYFAGQALIGMMSRPTVNATSKMLASTAYNIADAMIAERAK